MTEQKVINVQQDGECRKFCIRKIEPEYEANYIQVFEMISNGDGTSIPANSVRFYGSEFQTRLWKQKGFNKKAALQLMQRYFTAVEKTREEVAQAQTA